MEDIAEAGQSKIPDLIPATLIFRQILDSLGREFFAHADDMSCVFPKVRSRLERWCNEMKQEVARGGAL